MAFHVEDVERVFLAFDKPEGVEIHGAAHFGVLAADIHDEPVVDEHPHVVVALEFEFLSADVFELGLELHGEAEVVEATASVQVVVEDILDGLCGVEVFEVIQEEETLFRAAAVLLAEPVTLVVELEFEVAAGGVRVLLACSVLANLDRLEPVVKPVGHMAVFGEVAGVALGHTVWAECLLHHAKHGLAAGALAATASEVVTDEVDKVVENGILGCVATGPGRLVYVAVAAVQPVEHHHGDDAVRALSEDTRVFRVDLGLAVLEALDPECVAQGGDAIEHDFAAYGESPGSDFFVTFGTHVHVADGLLEADPEVRGFLVGFCFEPAAVVLNCGHDGLLTVNDHDSRGICPRRHKTDHSPRRGRPARGRPYRCRRRAPVTRNTGLCASAHCRDECEQDNSSDRFIPHKSLLFKQTQS